MAEVYLFYDIGEEPPIRMSEKNLAGIMRAIVLTQSKLICAGITDDSFARTCDHLLSVRVAVPVGKVAEFKHISKIPMVRVEKISGAGIE